MQDVPGQLPSQPAQHPGDLSKWAFGDGLGHSASDCFFSSSPAADDQTPCQATGLWPRRGAGHQGARVLPLHRLGQAGAQGDPAALQAKGCKCGCPAPPCPSARRLSPARSLPLELVGAHTGTRGGTASLSAQEMQVGLLSGCCWGRITLARLVSL